MFPLTKPKPTDKEIVEQLKQNAEKKAASALNYLYSAKARDERVNSFKKR